MGGRVLRKNHPHFCLNKKQKHYTFLRIFCFVHPFHISKRNLFSVKKNEVPVSSTLYKVSFKVSVGCLTCKLVNNTCYLQPSHKSTRPCHVIPYRPKFTHTAGFVQFLFPVVGYICNMHSAWSDYLTYQSLKAYD